MYRGRVPYRAYRTIVCRRVVLAVSSRADSLTMAMARFRRRETSLSPSTPIADRRHTSARSIAYFFFDSWEWRWPFNRRPVAHTTIAVVPCTRPISRAFVRR